MVYGIPLSVIWLVLVIVFAIVEAATVGLVAIWFAFGALLAMLAAVAGLNIWTQVVLFLIGSVVALWLLRGYANKHFNREKVKTNADRIVSMSGIVTEAIDNEAGHGQVRVGGQIWTARAQNGAPIAAGTKIVVRAIVGVRAIVEPEAAE